MIGSQIKAIHFLRAVILGLSIGASSLAAQRTDLENGFAHPPLAARSRAYWWWLNGNVTKESITRDLEQMAAKGMGGALIFDADGSSQDGNAPVPPGPIFGSPQWRELFKHTLREGDRLGLEIDLNITSGWNLGGPLVKPEEAMKRVTSSETQVVGGKVFDGDLPEPKSNLHFYRDICVVAYAQKPGAISHKPNKWFGEKALFKELGREFGGFSAPDASPLLSSEITKPGEVDLNIGDAIDLSFKVNASGHLHWDAPVGDWRVLRFGYTLTGAHTSTSSGNWQGLSIDHLSTAALQSYWKQVVDPLMEDAGPLAGKTLKRLQTDSWEMGVANWTENFATEFHDRRGYEITPFMPALAGKIIGSREVTNRFLADFRRTVADLIADRHYQALSNFSHEHGLGIQCESGGPHGAPIDALQCLGRDDMPMGEFWAPSWTHRTTPQQRFFMKQSATAAHVYGKTRACGEGFTSIGPHWTESPWSLKTAFDQECCEGLNLIYWHAFVCSPDEHALPGQQYFAGTHLNPKVTWWNESGAFFEYLNRCQFMLQQGHFAADVLYYYGDLVPNFVQLSASDPAKILPGYDYDVANDEVLLQRADVKDGRITLPDGMSYRLLVLPDRASISINVLKKLHDLVNRGATVLGPKPTAATGLTNFPEVDTEVIKLAGEMWGNCDGKTVTEHQLGKGRIFCGKTAREVLAEDNIVPDFQIVGGSEPAAISYIHRVAGDADIYFVANLSDIIQDLKCAFRVTNKQPEIWSPSSGEIHRQYVFAKSVNSTSLPFHLNARESRFVVFKSQTEENDNITAITHAGASASADVTSDQLLAITEPGEYEIHFVSGKLAKLSSNTLPAPIEINSPWTVHFAQGWGAPETVTFPKLISWTDNPEPAVKYFSGTAVYQTTFDIPAGALSPHRRWTIDLGTVREIAHLKINGIDHGTLWESPAAKDVTDALKEGSNTIEIVVTNLWPNRLIGDANLPADQRKTKTNIVKFSAQSPLLVSGLLGPVRLSATELLPIN